MSTLGTQDMGATDVAPPTGPASGDRGDDLSGGARRWPRPPAARVAVVAVAAAVGAVLALAFAPLGYLNFDQTYALVWGSELLDGVAPSYDAASTPTPHPLATALGALGAAVGPGAAERLLTLLALAALATTICAVALIARAVAGTAAGVLAGVVVGTSVPVVLRTLSGAADLHVVALVSVAVLVEMRRTRAGVPVLLLLAVAGLQRPEAWVLSAAYWLWLFPSLSWRRRFAFALLAAAAPLIWAASDLAVTGNPLFSFVETREAPLPADPGPTGAAAVDAQTAAPGTVEVVGRVLRTVLRLPVVVGALLGIGFAWLAARRRAGVPLALVGVWLLVILAFGAIDLPIDDRFLFPPAAMLAVFFGVAAGGWTTVPSDPPLRRVWPAVGVLLVLSLLASVPDRARSIERVADGAGVRARAVDDLRALLRSPDARRVVRSCGTLFTPNYRLLPFALFSGDLPIGTVRARERVPPARGAFLVAATPQVSSQILTVGHGRIRQPAAPPDDAVKRSSNRSWRLLSRGC